MTSSEHTSGTDRVAEVARDAGEQYSVIINIQGDEPLLTSRSQELLLGSFQGDASPEMATLWEPFESASEVLDPNNVKVVMDGSGKALYFSRSPIPYVRGTQSPMQSPMTLDSPAQLEHFRKHQGIYAYRRDALLNLTGMPPSPLERAEGLEQLRALEAGYRIHVVKSDFRSQSVDTPKDLERLSRLMLEAE